jgi:hypothetical protein
LITFVALTISEKAWNDHLPALTTDLVRQKLSAIVTTTSPSILAAKAAF